MEKLRRIHIGRIVGMPIAVVLICAMLVLFIELHGDSSILSPFLMALVYFIVDFFAILFTKKDTFKIKYTSFRCSVWQIIFKVFFYIDIILGSIFLIIGIISTIFIGA